MNIGVDISCLSGGRGPARYVTQILKSFAKICRNGDYYYLYSPIEQQGCDISEVFIARYLPRMKGIPWLNWTLPRAVKKDRMNVMLFPANGCWLWRAAPTVVALLDVAQQTTLSEYLPGWKDRLQLRLQMNRVGKIAKRIVTISQFSANEIGRMAPLSQEKIKVIYCGISEAFSSLTGGEKEKRKPYILFVGGFDRRKNLDRLLQAFKMLIRNGREEVLYLVGNRGKNPKLYYDMPDLIRHYGLEEKVLIKTEISDQELIDCYVNASLLVLPSIVEGFGLPVIEAHACGCPVACSNAASLPEIAGAGACYFDPFDIYAIANSMNKILTDETYRVFLQEAGRENVRRFSWNRAGEQIYAILKAAAIKNK